MMPAYAGSDKVLKEFEFSYNTSSAAPSGYGQSRCDRYDIAIHISDSSFAGGILKEMSVPLPEVAGCRVDADAVVWVSGSLPDSEINPSECLAYVGTRVSQNEITCRFPDGFLIPADGIYVGYSVEVVEIPSGCRKYPIAVVEGSTPGSLYYRTAQTGRWDATFSRMEYMSAMKVVIEKEVPLFAVAPVLPVALRVKAGEEHLLDFKLRNLGAGEVGKIEYRIRLADRVEIGEIAIDDPAAFTFNSEIPAGIPFTAPDGYGDEVLEFEVSAVNGSPNQSAIASASTAVRVLPMLPKFRPLVDEYTGLWCGNCPPGWVALEESRDLYGDKFVFVTYHINDILSSGVPYPFSPSSVPAVVINRGKGGSVNDIYTELPRLIDLPADVDIDVRLTWTDESRTRLKADAVATFVENVDSHDYRMELLLVCDRLSNPAWGQTNYSAGLTGKSGKYWDIFTKGGAVVFGLEYNSVPALHLADADLEGKFPTRITEFEPNLFSGIFNLEEGLSNKGVLLTGNKNVLRVVALITERRSKRLINAMSSPLSASAPVADAGGAESIPDSAEVAAERLYDLQGCPIDGVPADRPYVKVTIYSDGTMKSQKIIALH